MSQEIAGTAVTLESGTSPESAASTAKLEQRLNVARDELARLSREAMDRGRVYARMTDEMAHERPWTAVGIAAGIGVLVGFLLARR